MIRSEHILNTVDMIQKEKLDVRTVTLGINIIDCRDKDIESTCNNIISKIQKYAGNFVATCNSFSEKYAVHVVNKRIAVSPVSLIGAGYSVDDYVKIAQALDQSARIVGIDIIGGYSANVEKGFTNADKVFFEAVPKALAATERVCSSINLGSTRYGINMDAVKLAGNTIKDLAELTKENDGFGAAKFVVFCNQPGDNPFMAGAIHGTGEAEAVINVGVSGPGVIARALDRKINMISKEAPKLHDLAEEIKLTAFKVTRCGELIGRKVAESLNLPFGVVDLSLAPTPDVGDSIGEIMKIMGVDAIGAPGSTAIIAMLNDAVKKGGAFASQFVGGLSGAFIPVMEDAELAAAVKDGALTLEKLEAMTCVCSVGLDMIAVSGDVDNNTLSAIIADEMAIGMINSKTTAVRIIPVPGKKEGDFVSFGGLFGESVIMPVNNVGKSDRFVNFAGRIPAPIHSLKN